jgi:hypothetical protein
VFPVLLIKEQGVEECDATEADSSTTVGYINIQLAFIKAFKDIVTDSNSL